MVIFLTCIYWCYLYSIIYIYLKELLIMEYVFIFKDNFIRIHVITFLSTLISLITD